ncbi:cbb3-type cytochrome oxidase assembly protein CcoS [Colwellia sp. E2M01]|uniref:cbb3-type cytochrome oxidase assembly protein CcoS n=1 Tax=Colwellia sp. E2M01 TaxID=2841561 RepID=UPI001C08F3EF|nr:cbb3-type cytochrome oxidase assembly protein CcoS [Colwellia sp. E2M01]MBU2869717.1 cbb3-type cytochrome oxidase assembly protein CcoS [Colwellia sp. E2M01]
MSIIYILIPIAALLTALGIYLFFWAVKTEQFDDLEKQGMSILFDDKKDKNTKPEQEQEQKTTTPQSSTPSNELK